MVFSTDKSFLKGWDDFNTGNNVPPNNIENLQMWLDGWDAAKVYSQECKEEQEYLELGSWD